MGVGRWTLPGSVVLSVLGVGEGKEARVTAHLLGVILGVWSKYSPGLTQLW